MLQPTIQKVKRRLHRIVVEHLPTRAPDSAHENEVYRGYNQRDIERTATYANAEGSTKAGFVTDFLGIRTSVAVLPYVAHLSGQRVSGLPFPDDSMHADGIEYAALSFAVDGAASGCFTAMELGAGWGPWLAASGVLAKRRGIAEVRLVGVEADSGRYEFMFEHLHENGLRPLSRESLTTVDGVTCDLRLGAAWWENSTLYFPVVDSANDHGGAVSQTRSSQDYRGLQLDHREVQAFSVPELLDHYLAVDFLHVDIQGSEGDLITRCLDSLNRCVKHMFIGTHNRKIEGDLIDLLMRNGWDLLNEKPCRFDPLIDRPTLTGKTTRDGAQFWVNQRQMEQFR